MRTLTHNNLVLFSQIRTPHVQQTDVWNRFYKSMTYMSEIFHKWFSFPIFDDPFFSRKQCSWADWLEQHWAYNPHSNAHIHVSREVRTRENRSSITSAINFETLIRNPWKRAFVDMSSSAAQQALSALSVAVRTCHSTEVDGSFAPKPLKDRIPP